MRELYYAYGSNMSTRRLLTRVPAARSLGRARLVGMRLVCNKPGRDGSGKANLELDPAAHVWGVLYEIQVDHWALLDRHESGYERKRHHVQTGDGRSHDAQLYLYLGDGSNWLPNASYREHLLEGAREHRLPEAFVETIASWSVANASET